MKLNKSAARAELKYRSLPKPRPARKSLQGEGEVFYRISQPQQTLAFNASGEVLVAAAGTIPTPKAQAPKATPKARKPKARKAVDQNAKLLRDEAWAMRQAAVASGQKLTYAQACEALGVKPARAA